MDLLYRIKTFIYPERCPYCSRLIEAEQIACESCLELLRQKHRAIPGGAGGYRCISTFAYGGRVRRMILRLKYRDRTQYLPQVAVIMADDIRRAYDVSLFDGITYVPIHHSDLHARSYNQSQLLAKALTKELGIPCLDTLQKVRKTPKQHLLTREKRKRNLDGAFKVKDKAAVQGKNLLLVDDIVTTGTTLGVCCKALNRAKPGVLCCATIASAQHQYDNETVI